MFHDMFHDMFVHISPDLDGYRAPKGINPTRYVSRYVPTRSRNPNVSTRSDTKDTTSFQIQARNHQSCLHLSNTASLEFALAGQATCCAWMPMMRTALLILGAAALSEGLPAPRPTGIPHGSSPAAPCSSHTCVGGVAETLSRGLGQGGTGAMHLRGGKRPVSSGIKQSPTLFSMTVMASAPSSMDMYACVGRRA